MIWLTKLLYCAQMTNVIVTIFTGGWAVHAVMMILKKLSCAFTRDANSYVGHCRSKFSKYLANGDIRNHNAGIFQSESITDFASCLSILRSITKSPPVCMTHNLFVSYEAIHAISNLTFVETQQSTNVHNKQS